MTEPIIEIFDFDKIYKPGDKVNIVDSEHRSKLMTFVEYVQVNGVATAICHHEGSPGGGKFLIVKDKSFVNIS